jgi:hypothetical protein
MPHRAHCCHQRVPDGVKRQMVSVHHSMTNVHASHRALQMFENSCRRNVMVCSTSDSLLFVLLCWHILSGISLQCSNVKEGTEEKGNE